MINDKNKHSWCVNAFHSLSGDNNGATKICCMIDDPERDELRLGTDPLSKHFDRKFWNEIRNDLATGKRHSACHRCFEEEDAGRKSKRVRDNERYEWELSRGEVNQYEGLAKVELNLGNTCNIKCRTCAPAISSKWMKEYWDVYESDRVSYRDWAKDMDVFYKSYDEHSPFWDDIEEALPTVQQFDFYGGEPFMSKKMWALLKTAVEKGYSKNISLHYNTNGTQWPKEVEIWKEFKNVNLSFSIDGIYDRFEYMRHPAQWSDLMTNLNNAQKFKETYPHLSLSWCITLSTINIFNLKETLDFYYKNFGDMGHYLNLVHGPTHYNINILPDEVKKHVVAELESISKEYTNTWHQLPGIINFIKNGKPNKHEWKKFLTTTEIHDVYRKENFANTFKEYNEVIRNVGF